MKIYSEINLRDFDAWSGGRDTLDRVIEAGKVEDLEAILEDIAQEDGWSDGKLNDLLWFDADQVFNWLDIDEEEEEEEEEEEDEEESEGDDLEELPPPPPEFSIL